MLGCYGVLEIRLFAFNFAGQFEKWLGEVNFASPRTDRLWRMPG